MGAFSFGQNSSASSTNDLPSLSFKPDEFAQHLRLRGSTYYFRQVFPRLGEVTLSLRTGDRRTAKGLSSKISRSLSARFITATTMPASRNSQQRLEEILRELREDAKDTLRTCITDEHEDPHSVQEVYTSVLQRIQHGTGEPEDFIKWHAQLEYLKAMKAKMDGNAIPMVKLATQGVSGQLQELLEAYTPAAPQQAPAPVIAHASSPSSDQADGYTFAQLTEQYIGEQKLKGKWSDKSELEAEAAIRVLIALVPPQPVDTLTRKDFVRVSELISNFPAQASKRFPDVSDLMQLALMEHAPSALMSITTQNKHTNRLSTILKWAEINGLIKKNLAEGLGKADTGKASEERDAFTNDDLRLIFKCIADKRTPKPVKRGTATLQEFHYWIPLLGYYTGARVNEIASLRPQDIRKVDDVWCIDICQQNDGTKKTKSKAGDRIVPIHPELLRLGLVEYALEAAMQGNSRLFMELKMTHNGYGGMVSNWFNGHPDKSHSMYLRAGVKGDNLSFHSLRHSFTTNMERAKVEPITLKRLVGHSMDDMTYGRYSKGIDPMMAFEELSKLPSLSSDILEPFEAWRTRA
ncbi:site-specific integrase [Craterilacuibacter sinensis]|uniref:Tyrosine-type recombinase/integrase n=1 Tax=Craterilacuibacter sinensis TaxID=2686017 RepID=A0A845BKQ4_9NEIS|nr:site-specific integrase [Craterilacuibacter sinensis]MXR36915.1 tyrosine-type recombinase/integrase [Craterilacuibacter sinensis]